MKTYLLTEDAEQDLDIIKVYLLGEDGSPLVQHVMDKIEAALAFLGAMPGAGHSREDLTCDPVKFWQVFSYFIIYDPVPRPIHITRIVHARRDLQALLGGD